jgi:Ca-activated chloride channel family protein
MTLLHPWVLLLLPLPWICSRFCWRLAPATLFPDPELLKRSAGHPLLSTRLLHRLVYALVLLVLADPVTRHGVTVTERPAYRIALLLDDSRSMEEDQRFTRAKAAMERFILARPDDALALGIFADYATVASPLTRDHTGLLGVLHRLETGMAGGRETALYEALWRGADLLEDERSRRGFVVLITDGLDTVGNLPLSVALERLEKRGIRVYAVGVGDDYRRDVLQRIARETGGAFYAVSNPEALPKILEQIDSREKSPLEEKRLQRYTHYDTWPIAAASILTLFLLWRSRQDRRELLRATILLSLLGSSLWLVPDSQSPPPEGKKAPPTLGIALDLSRSMEAKDCPPNRLSRAIHDTEILLKALPPDLSVSLLGFARQPYLIAPPTRDRERLIFLLRHLDPSAIDREGTAYPALIDHLIGSMESNRSGADSKEAALIVGDGGEAESYRESERKAKRAGLRLYGLAMATERGAPVPTPDGLMKDERGRLVLSRLNPAFVSLIDATGGTLLRCPTTKDELNSFAGEIARYLGTGGNEIQRDDHTRHILLWIAVSIMLIPATRWKKPSLLYPLPATRYPLALLFLCTLPIYAYSPSDSWHLHRAESAAKSGECNASLFHYRQIEASDDRILYNRANLLYRLGEYRKAASLYRQIEAPALQHARYHNLGNCMIRLGKPATALRYYRAALKFADDPDTRTNLAIAADQLKKIQKRQSRKALGSSDRRPGSGEGISEWEREELPDETKLKEAESMDRKHRANLAARSEARRSRIEKSATDREKNGTAGGNEELPSVAMRHWRKKMEGGRLRTLLLPIETEGEHDVPKPW